MMRPPLEMLLVVVALATHTRGLPYGELPSQLQTREYRGRACGVYVYIFFSFFDLSKVYKTVTVTCNRLQIFYEKYRFCLCLLTMTVLYSVIKCLKIAKRKYVEKIRNLSEKEVGHAIVFN